MKNSLPTGWEVTKIADVFAVNPGHAGVDVADDDDVSFVPMPEIEQETGKLNATTLRPYGEVKKGYTKFVEGDVLFAKITPCMENGKIAIASGLVNGLGCGTTEVFVFREKGAGLAKYLFYYLVQKSFRRYAKSKFNGAVGHLRVPSSIFEEQTFPLPPLAEQKRIVAHLDGAMQKLEASQERLEKLPMLLKKFRQAVLVAAVSGKLTEAWRDENSVSESSAWKEVTLAALLDGKPRNGYSPQSVDFETPVKSLMLSATTTGRFRGEYFKYIDQSIPHESHLWLQPDDILVQRANSLDYVGVSAMYEGPMNTFIYPDLMMKCRANETVLPRFLHYVLSSEPVRRHFRENATGTAGNMPKINQQTVMSAPVLLPELEEQREIVRQVNHYFALADQLEARFEQAAVMVEQLPQALLAKAFSGQLVPQDPNDEPASTLLERLQTSAVAPAKGQRGRKPKATSPTPLFN